MTSFPPAFRSVKANRFSCSCLDELLSVFKWALAQATQRVQESWNEGVLQGEDVAGRLLVTFGRAKVMREEIEARWKISPEIEIIKGLGSRNRDPETSSG
jgi:hypothetical protein